MKLLKLFSVVLAMVAFTPNQTIAAEAVDHSVNKPSQYATSVLDYQSITPAKQSVESESETIWNALELISACHTGIRLNLKSGQAVKFGVNAGRVEVGLLTGQSRSFGQTSNEATLILNFSVAARF